MSGKLTREDVRGAFAACLSYAQVEANDVRALEGYLAIEYARHERDGGRLDMRPSYRKAYQPVLNPAVGGGIESAYLRVSGFYFQGREAVSFNPDGYVGFAGWADDTSVQPFLRAFIRWLVDWMGCERLRGCERLGLDGAKVR